MELTKNDIKLRALEPEDLDFIFNNENNVSLWEVSGTQTPFSKFLLAQFIANSHLDIYEAKQLRLIIEYKKQSIGMIDLFDFNPQHNRAGIGIFILDKYQNKGFASISLELMIQYSFKILFLHQIYANIQTDNLVSKKLFKKAGFTLVGIKKEWNLTEKGYKDIELYQLINKTTVKH
jgi:diamine N-acetyltransferase